MRSLLSFLHVYSVIGVGHSFRSPQFCRSLYVSNFTSVINNLVESKCIMHKDLSGWSFAPSKLQQLPIDEIKDNYVRRNVKGVIFSEVAPTPLQTQLQLVDYSEDVLSNILDMDPAVTESQDFLEFIAGNKVLDNSSPMAHRYGGHQFGSWAMQLGDGRAILLGEYINKKGEHWELQLKGAGRTPYSRDGDGRAVLRSSIREFLASEAMYYLGVPTSRAAALVVSDDPVLRDPLYNGYVQKERAAVVLRLAPTWFRFGSLEILTSQNDTEVLRTLTDFIIKEHFQTIESNAPDRYVEFFSLVCHLTVQTVVAWQGIGFSHGVLNTDNMSVIGLTIDYGPYGFLDAYDPVVSPNHSDHGGRYCYENQLDVIVWNLHRFALALSPLLDASQKKNVDQILQGIPELAKNQLLNLLLKKLGLEMRSDDDNSLFVALLEAMENKGGDFTATFRQLAEASPADLGKDEVLEKLKLWSLQRLATHDTYPVFLDVYAKRLDTEKINEETRRARMNAVNPRYVLRNWIAESAIRKAENNDFSEVRFIQKVLKTPYTLNEEAEKAGYAGPTPSWAQTLKVSCSS